MTNLNDLKAPITFDSAEPIEVPVNIAGRKLILREISEADSCTWDDARLACIKRGPDGKILGSIQGLGQLEPLLVHHCLFIANGDGKIAKDADGDMIKVPVDEIKAMPARIVAVLHERAKAISEMDKQETVQVLEARIAADQAKLDALRMTGADGPAKNGPSATPST